MIPVWAWKWIGAAALLLSVAGWGVYEMIRADVATGRLAACQGRFEALQESVRRQNDGIKALQAAASARESNAKRDAAAAKREADTLRKRASTVLSLKPPPGTDACTAARKAFDAELREERRR